MKAFPEGQFDTKVFASNSIDVGRYVALFRRYLLRVLVVAGLVAVLAALYSLTLESRYTSTASLVVENRLNGPSSPFGQSSFDGTSIEYVQTQHEILESRRIAEKTVSRLSLHQNDYFDLNASGSFWLSIEKFFTRLGNVISTQQSWSESAVSETKTSKEMQAARVSFAADMLMERTTITTIDNTHVIDISVETPDPELSAQIANGIANVYVETKRAIRSQPMQSIPERLAEQTKVGSDDYLAKLNAASARLENFDTENNAFNLSGLVELATKRAQDASSALLQAKLVFQQERVLFNVINKPGQSPEELAKLPDILNHPTVRDLRLEQIAAQAKVAELNELYGERHPSTILAKAELTSANASIENQTQFLISDISTSYRAASRKVATLEREVNAAKAELNRLSMLQNQRKALEAEVAASQQLYDSFYSGNSSSENTNGSYVQNGQTIANTQVFDYAVPATSLYSPNRSLIIINTFIISFVVCYVLIFVRNMLDRGVRSGNDISVKLHQRMLGSIPEAKHSGKAVMSAEHFFDYRNIAFSESFRTIRTKLTMLNDGNIPKAILVNSGTQGEGKTSVCINLSLALGQLHRVLLLDADLRTPSIADAFSFSGFQPGLSNVLTGTHRLNECLLRDEASNLHLLTSGSVPANPQELLASRKFSALMNFLKTKFDCIVIDSPSSQALSDAVVISRQCDSVVYVVKSESTQVANANAGLKRFIEVGQSIDGVVLNQVDLQKAKRTGEYAMFYDKFNYNAS